MILNKNTYLINASYQPQKAPRTNQDQPGQAKTQSIKTGQIVSIFDKQITFA